MTLDPLPPDVEEELASIRKGVDALRAVVANHRAPEALESSDPAVLAVADAHDRALQELAPLGFKNLGSAGERGKDGKIGVSRWFAHSDGTTFGWLAFITTRDGPRLVVLLATEASGPVYCITLLGGSRTSLARPPQISHAYYESGESLADMVGAHRERVSSLEAAGMRLTGVTTLGEAFAVMERLHQERIKWRASRDERELWRADLTSILAEQHRRLGAEDFGLMYGRAAEWLDFHPALPTQPVAGDYVALAPGPLLDLLTSTLAGREAEQGAPGVESDWLFHCEFELQGRRLQMLDVYMAGNDDSGVILDASPGVYIVEARVITYEIDRRISRVRVHPKGQAVTRGKLAGEIGVDLAAVAICDVDRLAGWARDHQAEWQRWGDKLWFGRTVRAGLYTCEPANTVVAFVDSGFGDGTYPVYYLIDDGRPVGLEAEFIPTRAPYP